MIEQTDPNSRQSLFIIKTVACFAALLFAFAALAPHAFMQSEVVEVHDTVMSNSAVGNKMAGNYYKPTPEPPKSTVRGRVIYADTGQAVRRSGLLLMPAQKGSAGGRENAGTTNERGEFEIKGVAAGKYFMSVSTPGVLTPTSSMDGLDGIEPGRQSEAMIASIAKDFQEININGVNDADVVITVKRGAVITGKIMYSDGEAAIGVRVEILRKKAGQYNAVITSFNEIFGAIFGGAAGGLKTDDRGVFRVAGLPAGEYIVRAVENVTHSEKSEARGDGEMFAMLGFNPSSMVTTYFPNASDPRKAEIVKVELGQEQSEVNITIPDRTLRAASGTVINRATRQPVKGARIVIKGADNVNSMFGAMGETMGGANQTDEFGRWNYKELPAGHYTLTISPPYDYQRGESQNAREAKQPKMATARREIVVDDKDLTDLTIEMGYGASISGTISFDGGEAFDQPIIVSATDEAGKFSESQTVGSTYYDRNTKPAPKKSQEFKIEGVAEGKVFVGAAAGERFSPTADGGAQSDAQKFYVKNILLDGKDIKNSAVETKEGEELKGVQIILSRDIGEIKGTVVKSDKSPAAGARIGFIPTDKSKWANFGVQLYAVANNAGEFETFGAPGEYFVIFYRENDFDSEENKDKSVAEQRIELLERKTADAQKLTIKEKETEKIALTMPENQ